MLCPCGSKQELENCCKPFIEGQQLPETAEQLMRSRYTAFAIGQTKYLLETLAPDSRSDYDAKSTEDWARSAEWLGLEIIGTKKGSATDKTGVVEFTANYKQEGKSFQHHEVSNFKKVDGRWYFVDGESHTHEGHHNPHPTPVIREEDKIGRNDPCPCGSGKKYKKCCAA